MPLKQTYGHTRPNYITSPRHPQGLFAELLTPGVILPQLTKVNKLCVISSFPSNYKHAILLAVKPAYSRLTKLLVHGLFWSSVMGTVIVPAAWQRSSNAVHSRQHPFPLKLKGRGSFSLLRFFWRSKRNEEKLSSVTRIKDIFYGIVPFQAKNRFIKEFLLFLTYPATTTFVYLNRKRHLC